MPGDSEDTRTRINALRKAYVEQLPGKIREVEEIWKRLESGSWNPGDFQEFHRFVHALAGSGAMFGYPAVSTSARSLDLILKALDAGRAPDAETARRISSGLSALKEAAAS